MFTYLGPLTPETTSKSQIFGLADRGASGTDKRKEKEKGLNIHGDTLSVNGSQIGVFEERVEICLSSFLQRHDGRGLEAQVGL